jgi:hypothetical protein
MSKHHQFLLLLVSAAAVVAFARSNNNLAHSTLPAFKVNAGQSARPHAYLRPGALWPQLRWNLRALGDRLETPGKEQITASGVVSQPRGGGSGTFILAMEAPRRITFSTATGLQSRITNFDATPDSWTRLSDSDRSLVETLLFDSAEGFFLDHVNGAVTRALGSRFKIDESTPERFYDLYAVIPRHQFTSAKPSSAKLFWFNSDTRLLELVTYEIERNGESVKVEVKLGNWDTIQGQKVARRIERRENGASVLTIQLDIAGFSALARP